MSDGGQPEELFDSENVIEVVTTASSSGRSRVSENDFGRSVSRMSVAQICESVGFEGFNESALETIADIAVRYLSDLGKTSKSYANLACRTESNVFDVIRALEDLGFGLAFFGDVEGDQCGMSSGVIREIVGFVDSSEEIPFVQPVPSFPVVNHQCGMPSFLQMGEVPEVKHIPAWLPAFPDAHTYRRTTVWNERVTDPREDKIELARQHRKAERSLLSLQQLFFGYDVEKLDEGLDKVGVNGIDNPYVSKPFKAGEKEATLLILPDIEAGRKVSALVLPAKRFDKVGDSENYPSFLDTFAPAIEATKGVISESPNDMEITELVKRPALCLQLKRHKNVLHEPLDLRLQSRTASWFGRDDDRDDKKRRGETIFGQALENQQDLGQM